MINKSWCKLLSESVIFSRFSSDISLDFHESIRVVPLKDLIYFLAGIILNNFEIFLKKNILLHEK